MTKLVYIRAFAAGFITLSLEVLAPRLMAPYFGLSHFTWTAIICMFLLGISLGYTASAFNKIKLSYIPFLISISIILFGTHEFLFPSIRELTSIDGINLMFANILFAPSAFFLAYLVPVFVAQLPYDVRKSSGLISMYGTLGSIIGALLTGTLLIKYFSHAQILLILTALSGLFYPQKKVILTVFLFFLAGLYLFEPPKYLSHYQPLKLIKKGDFLLLMSGLGAHNKINTTTPRKPIARYSTDTLLATNYVKKLDKVLVLGAGTNSVGSALLEKFPELHLDAIEIDPVVVEIARKEFFAHPRANFVIKDARQFLLENKEHKYDFIFLDAFRSLSPPPHLFTLEFFDLVKSHLTPHGIIVANLPYWEGKLPTGTLLKTFKSSFRNSLMTTSKYNMIVIGSDLTLKKQNSFFTYSYKYNFSEIKTNSEVIHTDDHPLWF